MYKKGNTLKVTPKAVYRAGRIGIKSKTHNSHKRAQINHIMEQTSITEAEFLNGIS